MKLLQYSYLTVQCIPVTDHSTNESDYKMLSKLLEPQNLDYNTLT